MAIILTVRQKRHLFILLFLSPFLLGTGVDLYVPSLPAITKYFQVSKHLVQQTISLYMLGYAVGQLFLGVLSDSLGRKKILISCGMLFAITSFAAVFSPNIYFLMAYRFLQGLAIAGPALSNRAMAADCFSGLALNKAVSYYSMSWALGPIVGPFIGSYLQHYFGWQANFYFFGIYALLTFTYACIVLPETHIKRSPLHAVKIYKALKTITTHSVFLLTIIIGSCFYGLLVIFNVIAPFLIQIDLNYSTIAYGRIALLLGFGYFLGTFMNRFLVHRFAPDKITIFGLAGSVFITLIMLILGVGLAQNLYMLVLPVFCLFMMCGFILPNNAAKGLMLFPQMIGTATSIFGSLGIGGVFLFSSLATLLPTQNQVPLALLYVAIASLGSVLFLIAQRLDQHKMTGPLKKSQDTLYLS